jgi:N6-L-threonylcarbamoyladenine synthase
MILGIDTSNYTTSVCLIDMHGIIAAEHRQLLKVKQGERGLQQSAAVFQHVHNLPALIEKLGPLDQLKGICVSAVPRPQANSYMPVFMTGEAIARSLASALDIPLFRTSHQEGHIAAGEGTTGQIPAEEFLAIHLSGGTTDLLQVKRQEPGYDITVLGSSIDLHAGQFVDRIGVALGLPFPAGTHLEKLASSVTEENLSIRLPAAVKGYTWSFSGAEAAALRLIEAGTPHAAVARAVESCIAKGIEKVLLQAINETGLKQILIVGGVASNLYLRQRLKHRLEHKAVNASLYYAKPRFSSDNAYGVARLGLSQLTE